MFFQQATGQPTVLYYASSIFSQAGFSETTAAASNFNFYLFVELLLIKVQLFILVFGNYL